MKARTKLFPLLGTALVLAAAPGIASALRSIEIGGRLEASGTARALTFEGEGTDVICSITLDKTLNASIAKTPGAAVGNAKLLVGSCEGGRAIPLNTAAGYPITYVSFTGTLPRIASVRLQINEIAALLETFGGLERCLYRGNTQLTTGPNERVTELRFDDTVQVPLFRNLGGGFPCPPEGSFRGTQLLSRTILLRLT